jgi:hypothetical protein
MLFSEHATCTSGLEHDIVNSPNHLPAEILFSFYGLRTMPLGRVTLDTHTYHMPIRSTELVHPIPYVAQSPTSSQTVGPFRVVSVRRHWRIRFEGTGRHAGGRKEGPWRKNVRSNICCTERGYKTPASYPPHTLIPNPLTPTQLLRCVSSPPSSYCPPSPSLNHSAKSGPPPTTGWTYAALL